MRLVVETWLMKMSIKVNTIHLPYRLNPFHATGISFCTPLTRWENQRFSDVFKGYRKRPVAWNELSGKFQFKVIKYWLLPFTVTYILVKSIKELHSVFSVFWRGCCFYGKLSGYLWLCVELKKKGIKTSQFYLFFVI